MPVESSVLDLIPTESELRKHLANLAREQIATRKLLQIRAASERQTSPKQERESNA